MNDPIVGIDLGTSNSVVAHADPAGVIQILADDNGYKIHPSVVSFHPSGGVIVGAAAKQRKVIDPQNTIYSVKRLIGRGFRAPEVQTAKSRVPYQIKEGANQLPMIATRAGDFAIPEISAVVLDHVRNVATARLGTPVQRAVVTVPAAFNDVQRSATATAGAIAGLTVVRVLNEPTAAALAYGHTRNLRQIIAVYDFGGGTFDITILKLDDQVYEVLGTAGDTFLGGDDLDERLVDKMVAKFLAENRIDLRTNEVSMMRLRAVAEQTKIELSRRSRAVVRVDEIAYGPKGVALNLQIEISRDEFVTQVTDIVERTFPVCREAVSVAGIGVDQIDDIILVGGTTKIPFVRDQVTKFFGKAPRSDVNPEEAVAVGAALQASSLERMLARPRSGSSRVATATATTRADDEETTNASPLAMDVLDLADEPPPSLTTETVDTSLAPDPMDGAETLPDPRTRRATAGYADRRGTTAGEIDRPDTSYSLTRDKSRVKIRPTSEDTEQSQSTPLARLSRPSVTVDPPSGPVGPSQKTMFGVPAGPELPRGARASGLATGDRASTTENIPSLSPASTAPGMGTDSTTLPRLPAAAPDEWGLPASRPRAPAAPVAAPTAPTLMAMAAPTAGPPSAASTSKGIGLGAALQQLDEDEPPRRRAPTPPPVPPAPGAIARYVAPAPSYAPLPPRPPVLPPQAPTAPPSAPTVAPYAPAVARAPVAAPPPAPIASTLRPPVLLEVTPRGLGIATVAGFCEELIRRNSRLPTEMKKLFTTSRDRQDVVRIVVCQGESRRLDKNVVIGDLVLQNLPPRPRGETSIEVTFSVDASGILHIRARDAQTGTEQHASLDLVGGMQQEDVAASRERFQQLRR